MATKLEQIAVKARREPNLHFTSLAHHITREPVLKNLQQIPKHSAAARHQRPQAGGRDRLQAQDWRNAKEGRSWERIASGEQRSPPARDGCRNGDRGTDRPTGWRARNG